MMVLFLLILYLTIAGVLTILESKIIGIIQSSVGGFKFSFFGIFQFFIDFFKLIGKTSFNVFIFNIYNSFLQTIIFLISNILFVILAIFFINVSDYFFSNFITLIIFVFINLLIKIICYNFFCSSYINDFINSLNVIISLLESLSIVFDLGYIVLFDLEGLYDFLLTNVFSYNFLFQLSFISFFVCLMSSFSCPFDFIESESECLNSLFTNVSGLEYALWTLFEYLSIMNNLTYFLVVLSVSLGFGFQVYGIIFIIILIIICFISASLFSFSVNTFLSSLLSFLVILFIWVLLFLFL